MKKTLDIKIKKIEVKNDKVCPILTDLEMSKISKSNKKLMNFFDFLKQKVAYISFAFMSFSALLYIFFITSIIIFAVQERSYIFSASKIEVSQNSFFVEKIEPVEGAVEDNVNNLAVLNEVIYIKRNNSIETTLSVR
jgi:hypothetical protein